ncbi:MAG: hypothetical protein EXQ53_04010 [Acidobacteria bacterium]|nr:hypothetical protein [Acidobacteriota bacterium]
MALALAGAALLLGPLPVVAHHGAATFDTSAEITVKGTVTEWIWSNPHCFLKFDVKGEDGTTRNWAIETGNVADASKRGWARRSFKPGDDVTVTLQPSRSGAPVGRARTVVLADGRKFE